MDTSFLSAMLTLNGKNDCGTNLTKVSRIMNACSGLNKDGTAQKSLFSLLGELNPKYRPVLTVFDKIKPLSKGAPIPMSKEPKEDSASPCACSSFAQFCASSSNACPNEKNNQSAPAASMSGENSQSAPAASMSGENSQSASASFPRESQSAPVAFMSGESQSAPAVCSSRNNAQTAYTSCPSNKNSQSTSAYITPPTEKRANTAPASDYEPFIQYNNQSAHINPLKENCHTASASFSSGKNSQVTPAVCLSRNNMQGAYTACPINKNRNAPITSPAEAKDDSSNSYEPFVQYNNETLKRR